MKKILFFLHTYGLHAFLKKVSAKLVAYFFYGPLMIDRSVPLPAPSSDQAENCAAMEKTIKTIERRDMVRKKIKPHAMEHVTIRGVNRGSDIVSFHYAEDPLVSIIIPVYNNLSYTLECLRSIEKYSDVVSFEIIIVDDFSTDDTQIFLSTMHNITYIRNIKNVGFGHSCNIGAEKSRGTYVLFLNNDAQVTDGWLIELVKTFEDFRDVGAVGGKIIYPDGRLQEAGALINADCTNTLIGTGNDPNLSRYNYVRAVDYCSAVCLLVPAKVFKDCNGFDDEFRPAYCEDVDFCLRLKQMGLHILYNPKVIIIHHLSVTSNSIEKSYKAKLIRRNQQKLSARWQNIINDNNKVRLIAFYLPQFYPIPENDRWWGKDFTEWTNVSKAKANFIGHYQPHIPADFGFYDLRLEKVMQNQAELAGLYGLYGFCYYYYWFNGKRLLEMPLERMLETDTPNFPFCLAWANESWTRTWDGQEKNILIEQVHSDIDDHAVVRDIIRYMKKKNYIRINGKPVLLIYRPDLFADITYTIQRWREDCRDEGVGEIYLVLVESFDGALAMEDPKRYGFDASVEFPPHHASLEPLAKNRLRWINKDYKGTVYDYRELICEYVGRELPAYTRFRSVVPSWDNTPRRQNDSHIFHHSTPGFYQAWLTYIVNQTREQNNGDERIVFINAWNEWGEGAHLEPDLKFGRGYLEATHASVKKFI